MKNLRLHLEISAGHHARDENDLPEDQVCEQSPGPDQFATGELDQSGKQVQIL